MEICPGMLKSTCALGHSCDAFLTLEERFVFWRSGWRYLWNSEWIALLLRLSSCLSNSYSLFSDHLPDHLQWRDPQGARYHNPGLMDNHWLWDLSWHQHFCDCVLDLPGSSWYFHSREAAAWKHACSGICQNVKIFCVVAGPGQLSWELFQQNFSSWFREGSSEGVGLNSGGR